MLASVLVVVAGAAAVQAARQAPLSFLVIASADSYLSSALPATTFGNSAFLSVSRTATAGTNWSLVAFDLFGKLHPGDRVLEASMMLTVTGATSTGWPASVRTARILNAWSEANTTWDTRSSVVFDTSVNLTFSVSPEARKTVTLDVTKQVSRWHSYGGPSNYGTALMMDGESPVAGVTFASRENPTTEPPTLLVKYSPAPRTIYGYAADLAPVAGMTRIDSFPPAT